MLNILIYLGTHRANNYSQTVAKFVTEQAKKNPELSVELIQPTELDLQFANEGNGAAYPELQKKVAAADGFIMVVPEYNHGYPATIKFLIDLFKAEYEHKPVAFVGVSSGVFGGARMIEVLSMVVRKLRMVATPDDVNFGMDEVEIKDGVILDPAKWERRVGRMLEDLIWMAKALQKARAEQAPKQ